MAEAHELVPGAAILDPGHEVAGAQAVGVDLGEHLQDGLVGPAVQRPEQRVDAGRDAGEHVGVRGAHQPDRGRRAVLLVVGVQDEQHVQGAHDQGVGLVGGGGHAERQAQEVLGEGLGVVWVEERLADGLLVGVGRDRGQLGQEPNGRDVHLVGIEGIQRVLVERRQCRDRRAQHRHRVGVAREPVEEPAEVLVEHRVRLDVGLELLELVGRRELAVDQQVAHLGEGRVRRQLLDRVPAVAQDPGVAVDVRDGRSAGRGVHESRVVGHVPGVLEQHPRVPPGLAIGGLELDHLELAVLVDQLRVTHGFLPCRGRRAVRSPYPRTGSRRRVGRRSRRSSRPLTRYPGGYACPTVRGRVSRA